MAPRIVRSARGGARAGVQVALDGIDFDVREGEVFGFLGPNGAGKTTTIKILTGLARADSGTVRIAGIDTTMAPRAAQHLVGVVPDESNLYWLEDKGLEVGEARKVRPSLEDVFVRVTGIEAAAMRKERDSGGGGA